MSKTKLKKIGVEELVKTIDALLESNDARLMIQIIPNSWLTKILKKLNLLKVNHVVRIVKVKNTK